jgi:hypothetical protein
MMNFMLTSTKGGVGMIRLMENDVNHASAALQSNEVMERLDLNLITAGTRHMHGNIAARAGGVLTRRKHAQNMERMKSEPLQPLPSSIVKK